MELREAVEMAKADANDWALQVTASEDAVQHFNLVSYDSAVKRLVVDFCQRLGLGVRDGFWFQVKDLADDPDRAYQVMVEACAQRALTASYQFFAIGWVMGAPEYQLKAKNKETFFAAMRATSTAELKLLEKRFAGEEFLRLRFSETIQAASVTVSTIFAQQKVPLSAANMASWCAITASLPTFEAYELGIRARMLIEEDVALEAMAADFA